MSVIIALSFLLVVMTIVLIYITALKLSARGRDSTEKRKFYACGEEEIIAPDTITTTFFRYVLLFSVLETVPLLIAFSMPTMVYAELMLRVILVIYIVLALIASYILTR